MIDSFPAPVEWRSTRPPLELCTEAELLDDVWSFLQANGNKQIDKGTFPDAIVNGR